MRARKRLRPRKRPSQERSQFTVEQILDAAARVFAERGRAGATTNHIAERAGVSVGSLYQYFPNKDAILVALLERHMETVRGVLQGMLDEALREQETLEGLLRRFVRKILEMHTSELALQRALLYEAPRTPEIVEKLHRIEDDMARVVERLLALRHGVSRRHAAHAAYLLVHVIDNLVHAFLTHPPQDMPMETFVEELVTMLHDYVRGRCSAVARGGRAGARPV